MTDQRQYRLVVSSTCEAIVVREGGPDGGMILKQYNNTTKTYNALYVAKDQVEELILAIRQLQEDLH